MKIVLRRKYRVVNGSIVQAVKHTKGLFTNKQFTCMRVVQRSRWAKRQAELPEYLVHRTNMAVPDPNLWGRGWAVLYEIGHKPK